MAVRDGTDRRCGDEKRIRGDRLRMDVCVCIMWKF